MKKTNEEFLLQAKSNYKITVIGKYERSDKKVLVKCNKCGLEYEALPGNILKGYGCRKCANDNLREKFKISQDDFKKEIEIMNDDIEVVGEYVNNNVPVLLRCKKCGFEFKMKRSNIVVRGVKCYNCENTRHRKEHEDFVNEIKEINPDIKIIGKYFNNITPIQCECLKCFNFWETKPTTLQQGKGCPFCKTSKGERRIKNFLDKNNIKYQTQYKFEDCKDIHQLPFDFFLEEYKTCIEYDGKQHFIPIESWGGEKELEKTKKHDNIKDIYCKENKIKLIRIPYYDYKKIEEILKEQLKLF